MTREFVDVLIIGAGLSGIGAACHLQRRCPARSYTILEARPRIGGTWDLFRYPGVRSDSDMYTLGYSFRPWQERQAIADGPAILKYIQETAAQFGIQKNIRFGHRVRRASWSTRDAQWLIEAERQGDGPAGPQQQAETLTIAAGFVFVCGGYYRYAQGYTPPFPGRERFRGRIVHPQQWDDDIEVAGRRVVVIGSGATAITLVPELARSAAHVTMLQRSPTYVVARPREDRSAQWLQRHLPARLAYAITRWQRILLGMYFFALCKRHPERAKRLILAGARRALGSDDEVKRHFMPRYNPWEQRLCLAPDGDFFQAIREQRASVVTDEIASFTEHGIRLTSGAELPADLIVTATGLELEVLAGLEISVDGRAVDLSRTLGYKGTMYEGIPNLACAFGYTNASWTLKCDLTCEYVCRLLNRLAKRGYRQCTPRNRDPGLSAEPWISLSSGYVQRAQERLPKQGAKPPWRLAQNYLRDLLTLRFGTLEDGVMEFSNPGATAARRMGSPASRR